MYERLLSEAQHYLEQKKDDLVRVRTLWKIISEKAKKNNFVVPSLTDFACLLDGDKRFEFVALARGAAVSEGDLEEDVLEHEELGKLGFREEQYVRLRRPRLDDDEDEMSSEETLPIVPVDDDVPVDESHDAFETMIFSPPSRGGGRPNGRRKPIPAKKKSALKKTSSKKRKK
ncbi:MAG: hypothetical protein KGJ59_08280 [Bacteroidota bacterium]|nr:hypothetical protein [Bacteroidota bacterium]